MVRTEHTHRLFEKTERRAPFLHKPQRNMLAVHAGDFFQRFDRGVRSAGIFKPLVDLKRYVEPAGDLPLATATSQCAQHERNCNMRPYGDMVNAAAFSL